MTQHLFLTCFLAGTLGILLQIFVVKLPSLKTKSEAANRPFVVSEYFKDDWMSIVGSFLALAILIVCLDELINFKPSVVDYIKWLFAFVGFTGSSLIQAAFSVTNKKIMQVIDEKTNIADNKTGV
jgi:uncharacterized integral membrane protein